MKGKPAMAFFRQPKEGWRAVDDLLFYGIKDIIIDDLSDYDRIPVIGGMSEIDI